MRYVDGKFFDELAKALETVARTSKTENGMQIAVELSDDRIRACTLGALVSLLGDVVLPDHTRTIPLGFGKRG